MTHKANCIAYCKEALQNLGLENFYNEADFNHYYRKKSGHIGNAFFVGNSAADFIITQANTALMNQQQIFIQQQNSYYGSQY